MVGYWPGYFLYVHGPRFKVECKTRTRDKVKLIDKHSQSGKTKPLQITDDNKCCKNQNVEHEGRAECVTDVLTTFWRHLWSSDLEIFAGKTDKVTSPVRLSFNKW